MSKTQFFHIIKYIHQIFIPCHQEFYYNSKKTKFGFEKKSLQSLFQNSGFVALKSKNRSLFSQQNSPRFRADHHSRPSQEG